MAGKRLKLFCRNISIMDAALQDKFNFDNLLKCYVLNMEDAFDRAAMLTYGGLPSTYLLKEVRMTAGA